LLGLEDEGDGACADDATVNAILLREAWDELVSAGMGDGRRGTLCEEDEQEVGGSELEVERVADEATVLSLSARPPDVVLDMEVASRWDTSGKWVRGIIEGEGLCADDALNVSPIVGAGPAGAAFGEAALRGGGFRIFTCGHVVGEFTKVLLIIREVV